MRLGSRVKLFEHLSEDKSQAVTSYELAEKTGVEGALLCKTIHTAQPPLPLSFPRYSISGGNEETDNRTNPCLGRFLRHLAASGIIREAGPDRYFACAMTTAIATKKYQDIMRFLCVLFPVMSISMLVVSLQD